MKLVMIDNYDSFTWNLVQYLGELGNTPTVVRNDEVSVDEVLEMSPDGLLISPGPCTPTEAGISVELVQRASGRLPILGVCLGHQSIGAAFGGQIVRADTIMHGKTSPVHHHNTDIFEGLPSPFDATRYHSLVIDADTLPDVLDVTAWSDSAKGHIVMGIAHRDHPTWGVQFHPESILTEAGKHLLANYLTLVEHHHG